MRALFNSLKFPFWPVEQEEKKKKSTFLVFLVKGTKKKLNHKKIENIKLN